MLLALRHLFLRGGFSGVNIDDVSAKYTTGEVSTEEEIMERPDNEWCRKFFASGYGEDIDEIESAPYVSPRVRGKGD